MNAKMRTTLLAVALLAIGFIAGMFFSRPADENKMTFASFGKNHVEGGEVLTRIRPELARLEQSKFELKKRASEDLLLQKLTPEDRKALALANANLGSAGPAPITKADVDAYLAEKKYDRQKLSSADIASIERTLAEERMSKFKAAQTTPQGPRIQFHIPRARGLVVKVKDVKAPFEGPKSAPIEIVVFSNYHCAACKVSYMRLNELKSRFQDKLKITYRFMMSDSAESLVHKAAEAAWCAHEQNHFAAYHEALLQKPINAESDLVLASYPAKLDTAKFEACLQGRAQRAHVDDDIEFAAKENLGAPTLLIDGEVFSGVEPFETLSAVIDSNL